MKDFTPRPGSCSWRALLLLDEHGAQFATDLADLLGIDRSALNVNVAGAVRHGLIAHERRTRNGRSHALWFLTPKAYPLIDRIQCGQMDSVSASEVS